VKSGKSAKKLGQGRDEDPEFFSTDPYPLKKAPDPAGQKSPDPDPHPWVKDYEYITQVVG